MAEKTHQLEKDLERVKDEGARSSLRHCLRVLNDASTERLAEYVIRLEREVDRLRGLLDDALERAR